MIRRLLLVLIPLVLPAITYYGGCLYLAKRNATEMKKIKDLPLLRLAAAGLLLMAVALVWFSQSGQADKGRVYIPPRYEGGKLIPSEYQDPDGTP